MSSSASASSGIPILCHADALAGISRNILSDGLLRDLLGGTRAKPEPEISEKTATGKEGDLDMELISSELAALEVRRSCRLVC